MATTQPIANTNPPTRGQRNGTATLGANRSSTATASATSTSISGQRASEIASHVTAGTPSGPDQLLGQQAAADDGHERDEDAGAAQQRQPHGDAGLRDEIARLRHVVGRVQGLLERADPAGRRPQGAEGADREQARPSLPEHRLELRRQLLGDVGRQVVADGTHDLRRGIADAQPARDVGRQRGQEDREREQREQEAVGEPGREVEHVVGHGLADEPLAEVHSGGVGQLGQSGEIRHGAMSPPTRVRPRRPGGPQNCRNVALAPHQPMGCKVLQGVPRLLLCPPLGRWRAVAAAPFADFVRQPHVRTPSCASCTFLTQRSHSGAILCAPRTNVARHPPPARDVPGSCATRTKPTSSRLEVGSALKNVPAAR